MKQKYFIGLLIIVLLGSMLRIWNAGYHGIWFDEKCSLLEANGISFSTLSEKNSFHNGDVKELFNLKKVVDANIAIDGGNGILYALALHEWISVFGPGDFSIRFISILFGIALIPLVWFFVIHFTGNGKLALLLAFLIALHPLLIAYSQQARSYSMATFFSFTASLFFLSIINNRNFFRPFFMYAGYAFCVTISLLLHYQSAYVFLGHALIMLMFVRDKKMWLNIFLVFSIVVICMVAWYFSGGSEGLKVIAARSETYKTLLTQNKAQENTFLMPATLKNILTGWLQVLLHLAGNSIQWSNVRIRYTGALFFVPLFFLVSAIRFRKKIIPGKMVSSLFILFLLAPVYATVLALAAGHIISFQPLYSIFSVPYVLFLLAAGFISSTMILKKWKRAVVLFLGFSLVITMFVSLRPVFSGTYIDSGKLRKPNPYIHVATQLSREAEPGDTIIFPSLIDAQLVNIYATISDKVNQKVDVSSPGKFILVRKSGVQIEIEDFAAKDLYY